MLRKIRLESHLTFVGIMFLLPLLIYITAFFLYPFIFNISLSFKDTTVSTYVRGTSPFVGLDVYADVLRDSVFWSSAFHTLQFTFFSLLGDFVIGFLLALLFNKHFPGGTAMRGILIIPWFTPLIVSASFFKWFMSEDGTINTVLKSIGFIDSSIGWLTDPSVVMWSVVAINVWLGVPFVFILLHTGLKNISQDLYEAANIDGASGFQKTFYITIPCLKPVILVTLMLGTVYTVKHFDIVWITTQGGPGNASHLFSTLSYQLALRDYQFSSGAVVANIMVLFVMGLVYLYSLMKLD